MKEILHFTAVWCKPCQKLKPILEQYISDHPDITYTKVDVDTDFETAKEWSVMSVPTLILVVDGDMKARHTGTLSYDKLDSFVNGK